jgi:hypothetical protein
MTSTPIGHTIGTPPIPAFSTTFTLRALAGYRLISAYRDFDSTSSGYSATLLPGVRSNP